MNNITRHHGPYPAIDPSRPELSQRGRAVLVTGSSNGIGFYIARAFAKAGASTVVLTGRHAQSLDAAVRDLASQYPDTEFLGRVLDVSDSVQVDKLWDGLGADREGGKGGGLVIDVLVLSAARVQFDGQRLIDRGHEEVLADLKTNVVSHLQFTHRFYHQKNRDPSKKLALLNVSTMSIHNFAMNAKTASYGLSKNAAALALQLLAREVPADDMQIVSFHPGFIFTSSARGLGFTDPSQFDHDDLPAHYAVWAASNEAAFLHGRYTWTEWDVEELAAGDMKKRMDSDDQYLRICVGGL
ncbi:hypothetical protein F5Y17DRAFT_306167 [Xylariaceae sp. FL0594]|nr:hypothetical protein F5Y17DRAFT_306167 [Xylariaceae sp. FL0594]